MKASKADVSNEELAHLAGSMAVLEDLHHRLLILLKRQWWGYVKGKHWTEEEVAKGTRLFELYAVPCQIMRSLLEDACRVRSVSPRRRTIFEDEYLASDNVKVVERAIAHRWLDYNLALEFTEAVSSIVGYERYNRFYLHLSRIAWIAKLQHGGGS